MGATGDLVAGAAARFIAFAAANQDDRIVVAGGATVNQPLGAAGFGATDDADGMEFVDALGQGQEQGHRAEGFAAEVLIQSGGDDAFAGVGKAAAHVGDSPVEELHFVNGDDFDVGGDVG